MSSFSGASICTDLMCSAFQALAKRLFGETQHVQVLGGLLAQEMVDPVDLRLLQHLVHGLVQLAEVLRRGAERLLVDHPGTRWRAGAGQARRSARGRRRAAPRGSARVAVSGPSCDRASAIDIEQAARIARSRSHRRRTAAGQLKSSQGPAVRVWCRTRSARRARVRGSPRARRRRGRCRSAGNSSGSSFCWASVKNAGMTMRLARSPVAPNSTKTIGGLGTVASSMTSLVSAVTCGHVGTARVAESRVAAGAVTRFHPREKHRGGGRVPSDRGLGLPISSVGLGAGQPGADQVHHGGVLQGGDVADRRGSRRCRGAAGA